LISGKNRKKARSLSLRRVTIISNDRGEARIDPKGFKNEL
jgi:hypothetical protein